MNLTHNNNNEAAPVRCACCKFSKLEQGQGFAIGGAADVRVCAFCAPAFGVVAPSVPQLHDEQLLDAWERFADDLAQWEINVQRTARLAAATVREFSPGMAADFCGGALVKRTTRETFRQALRTSQMLSTALAATEAAWCAAERFAGDTVQLEAITARPDVAPVWALWLESRSSGVLMK